MDEDYTHGLRNEMQPINEWAWECLFWFFTFSEEKHIHLFDHKEAGGSKQPAKPSGSNVYLVAHHVGYTIELPDYIVHSDEYPFCFDPTCPDKEDSDNVNMVNDWYQEGLVSREDADNIYHGRTV